MTAEFPETHSSQGKLQELYDATKDVDVADCPSDGFYTNATENELVKFHRMLLGKADSSKFAALVFEVRRRVQSGT